MRTRIWTAALAAGLCLPVLAAAQQAPVEPGDARTARVAALDADHDGKVSATELATSMEAAMRKRLADRAAAYVAARDTDGDGLLDAAELAVPPTRPDREARHGHKLGHHMRRMPPIPG